jgi:acetyltransferase-like isoleucine patch superfamily enzyme
MKKPIYLMRRLKEKLRGEHRQTLSQIILIFLTSKWRIMYFAYTAIYGRMKLSLWGAKVGKKLRLQGFLKLQIYSGKIIIGDNVRLNSRPVSMGGSNRRIAFRLGNNGVLTFKDGSGMTNGTIFCFNSVTICEGAMIGGGCEILDTDFHQTHPIDRKNRDGEIPSGPIVIGKNAFVGGCSIVKRGVTIGEGSMIATGSLVVKSVPPYEIWGGVPAKFIKKIEKKP